MKTVLTDNSLCAYPIRDDIKPELLYNYIRALKEAGVRYVELDFRTLMKLRKLPEGVGYIFRMVDPMFLPLAELYDFKYIIITYKDLEKKIKTDTPIMFESPYIKGGIAAIPDLVKGCVDGEIGIFRVRWAFEYDTPEAFADIYRELAQGYRPYPIDICPLNTFRTSVDTALKFTAANVDSLTLTAGLPTKYCSLEEYYFSLMTVFDSLPSGFDIHSLGRVSVIRDRVFQSGRQALTPLLNTLNRDLRGLMNAETGERLSLRVTLKDSEYLDSEFKNALERMVDAIDLPEELAMALSDLVRDYDVGVFNNELLHRKRMGLPN